ncbi:hypothetical protein CHS0354_038694 [Potamilus streckersoni]|uniref:Uncharacterized protein n=1 Tax=Potamilus streckersoni TaxID=2493646 RepID=A0AAE0SFM8_9BIVA|nr:hypothetical protein CHS0354_038694 [Potamilus streckersoni]
MASGNTYRARPVIITGSEAHANHSSNLHEKYFSSVNEENTVSHMDARHRQGSLLKVTFGGASQQSEERPYTRNVKREETSQSAGQKTPKIHEPQPFARTNVTKHDEIWNKESDTSRETSDHLSPPMKYITLQTAEELWRNFDPVDVLDSASDRSDSSTDTMIMMTTEEEQKNKEKINYSLKKYEQKHVVESGFHIDTHLGENRDRTVAETNRPTQESQIRQPVKVFINQGTNIHGDLSPDDGYGTNSSSGTVSSPFSLGFPLSSTNASAETENSNHRTENRPKLPNGAIKPKGQTSVRDTWAVKRKARVNDTYDDTLQERLQQLAIIEEEEGSVMSENQRSIHRKDSMNQPSNRNKNFPSETDVNMRQTNGTNGSRLHPSESDRIKQRHHDLVRNRHQLPDSGYIRDQSPRSFDQSAKNKTRDQGWDRPNPQFGHDTGSLSPVVTNSQGIRMVSTNPMYPNRNVGQISVGQRSAFENVNGGVSGRNGRKVPLVEHVPVGQDDVSASGRPNAPVRGQPSPVTLGYSDVPRFGKSSVPAVGQPSTPTLEPSNISDVQGYLDLEENNGNRSPISPSLQAMRGELLEKWSDMDRNYRNYCGFDDSLDGMSLPDDIKVNYFKDKVLKNSYGNDNYFQPDSYTTAEPSNQAGSAVTTSKSGDKGGTQSTSKNKFFQLLPSKFRPASYRKTNAEIEKEQNTKTPRSISGSASDLKRRSLEPEYVNINDLDIPCSTLGRHVSVDNLHKRPVFASSRDICKMFQMSGQGQDLWSRPGSQRHSFHAMPASYRNVESDQNLQVEMRPRASSTSVTSSNKTQMMQSVDSRMAVIQQRTSKGQVHSVQGLQGGRGITIDPLAANQRAMYSERTTNSSGSVKTQTSPADSKLSTLV